MPVNQISQMLYGGIKSLAENPRSARVGFYRVERLIFCYVLVRCTLLTAVLRFYDHQQNSKPVDGFFHISSLAQLDYFLTLATRHQQLHNPMFNLQFVLMAVFVYVCRKGLMRAADHFHSGVALRKFYLLIVRNTELFRECQQPRSTVKRLQANIRQELSQHSSLRKIPGLRQLHRHLWLPLVAVPWQSYRRSLNINLHQVALRQFDQPTYFHLPIELRIRCYRLVRLMDRTFLVLQLFIYMLELLLAVLVAQLWWFELQLKGFSVSSVFSTAWIILDVMCLCYEFATFARAGFTYCFFSVISLTVVAHKTRHGTRVLAESFRSLDLQSLSHTLQYYLTESLKVRVDIMRGNQELWSQILAAFLLTNIPANIYLLTRLVFDTLDPLERSIIWTVVLCQAAATGLVLIPLAETVQVIHGSIVTMPRFQARIQTAQSGVSATEQMVWFKLKLDQLLQCLCEGPKYGVTIGSMHPITRKAVVELFLMYVGYMLFAFNLRFQH